MLVALQRAAVGHLLPSPTVHHAPGPPQPHTQPTWEGTMQTAKPTARHREPRATSRESHGMKDALSRTRGPDTPGAPLRKVGVRRHRLRLAGRRMTRARSSQGPAARVLVSSGLGPLPAPGRRRRSACHRSMFPEMIQLDHQSQGLKLESVKCRTYSSSYTESGGWGGVSVEFRLKSRRQSWVYSLHPAARRPRQGRRQGLGLPAWTCLPTAWTDRACVGPQARRCCTVRQPFSSSVPLQSPPPGPSIGCC